MDFESQNLAIFDNVYSTELFLGLVIGLEHKGRPCKMCDKSWVILLQVRSR